MHRFDERLVLGEIYRTLRANEERAAMERALRELRRSRPSLRRRIAHALVAFAGVLEPELRPAPRERTSA